MAILVTGGAGYIGSHCVRQLCGNGFEVVVADDLSTGNRGAVKDARFYEGDIRDGAFLRGVFRAEKIDAVMHFAACSLVGESMLNPGKYLGGNVGGGVSLLEAMREHGVGHIVFSSTAAVYGEPETDKIDEGHPQKPTNPYGESKLMLESILGWYHRVYGINYACLRYFNVAGADTGGGIGEAHEPETHLIPIVLQAALGKRGHLTVYGTDYPTPDGTCIRDYIHVTDLIDAHEKALAYIRGGGSDAFNLGNGGGFSVRQIIEAAKRVTGRDIKTEYGERRAGDPAVLVASSEKARSVLGWEPKFRDIEDIIASAWKWHESHPDGY